MAENSKIEWTHHTHNFWVGCTKISPACDHCYAEGWAKRTGQASLWSGERRRTTAANWRKPYKWDAAARAAGVRQRVFTNSLADFFDNQVPQEWRADAWNVIRDTPSLDWLILTKRPQNISKMLPMVLAWNEGARDFDACEALYSNVWLGATVENEDEERRIRYLREAPASIRFLSCEPLLSPICPDLTGISWVITGDESGGRARESDPDWFRSVRDQCASQGVAYFHKQMTRKAPIPPDLMVREFPA